MYLSRERLSMYCESKHPANILDLELTIDPAPPGGIFGTMIFLYLMVCSIQEEMIATFCSVFKKLWGFKIRYHLRNCHFMYI